jgi:hypothetical protein
MSERDDFSGLKMESNQVFTRRMTDDIPLNKFVSQSQILTNFEKRHGCSQERLAANLAPDLHPYVQSTGISLGSWTTFQTRLIVPELLARTPHQVDIFSPNGLHSSTR